MIKHHLLIVDDDPGIKKLLQKFLVENGFLVSSASNISEARLLLEKYVFDIIIMDIMMPGESGLEFIQKNNNKVSTPIILLSALGSVDDRVNGLKSGADDYLAKPFEPKELLFRINNILKRTINNQLQSIFYFGQFSFNTATGHLQKNDESIHLTTTEIEILKSLCLSSNEVVTRDNISGSSSRAFDTQIARLRSKIEDDPKKPKFLQTIRGKGYVIYTSKAS